MKKLLATIVLALLAAASAHASCYTVMGPKGQVLSSSPNPPVDMSYQLHQTVPYKYGPGASMTFGLADENCGQEADAYYDIKSPTHVVQRDGAKKRRAKARRQQAKPANK